MPPNSIKANRTNAGVNAEATKKKTAVARAMAGEERERVLLLYYQIESESKYESTKESPKWTKLNLCQKVLDLNKKIKKKPHKLRKQMSQAAVAKTEFYSGRFGMGRNETEWDGQNWTSNNSTVKKIKYSKSKQIPIERGNQQHGCCEVA